MPVQHYNSLLAKATVVLPGCDLVRGWLDAHIFTVVARVKAPMPIRAFFGRTPKSARCRITDSLRVFPLFIRRVPAEGGCAAARAPSRPPKMDQRRNVYRVGPMCSCRAVLPPQRGALTGSFFCQGVVHAAGARVRFLGMPTVTNAPENGGCRRFLRMRCRKLTGRSPPSATGFPRSYSEKSRRT